MPTSRMCLIQAKVATKLRRHSFRVTGWRRTRRHSKWNVLGKTSPLYFGTKYHDMKYVKHPFHVSSSRRQQFIYGVEGEECPKVAFINLGLTCIGPNSSCETLITQRCPHEVTIDLDTTRFLFNASQLRLGPRCATCQVYIK